MDKKDIDYGKKNKYPKYYVNPRIFFIGFMIISFITAFIIGGIVLGKLNNETNDLSITSNQIDEKILTEIDSPEDWTEYDISNLEIVIKLPEKLETKGDWIENKIESKNGTYICFTNKVIKDKCEGEVLIVTSLKNNSSKEDKSFLNVLGFKNINNNYFLLIDGDEIELKNIKFKEFEGNENFKIIKIVGDNSNDYYPKKGFLGAVINTNNSDFPAITIQMKIDSDLNEFEFDQILKSISSTN